MAQVGAEETLRETAGPAYSQGPISAPPPPPQQHQQQLLTQGAAGGAAPDELLELRRKLAEAERAVAELQEENFTFQAELACKAAEERHGKSQLIEGLEAKLQFAQRELEESDSALKTERARRQRAQEMYERCVEHERKRARVAPAAPDRARAERDAPLARATAPRAAALPEWASPAEMVALMRVVEPSSAVAVMEGKVDQVVLSEMAACVARRRAGCGAEDGHDDSASSEGGRGSGGVGWETESAGLEVLLRVLTGSMGRERVSLESPVVSKVLLPLLESEVGAVERRPQEKRQREGRVSGGGDGVVVALLQLLVHLARNTTRATENGQHLYRALVSHLKLVRARGGAGAAKKKPSGSRMPAASALASASTSTSPAAWGGNEGELLSKLELLMVLSPTQVTASEEAFSVAQLLQYGGQAPSAAVRAAVVHACLALSVAHPALFEAQMRERPELHKLLQAQARLVPGGHAMGEALAVYK